MSGTCVALGQLSPGKQEVVTSGGERDHRGPGLVTGPPPPLKERLPDVTHERRERTKKRVQAGGGTEVDQGEGWRARPV